MPDNKEKKEENKKENKKENREALNTQQIKVIQDAEKKQSVKKKYLDQHFTNEFLNDYF